MASNKFQPKPKPITYPPYNKTPVTYEEEVTAGVIEWYMALGLPVPQEDLDACKGLDAAIAAEVALEAAKPAAPPKPVYGTPEFWKEWWAKKRAKEAALKEGGEGGTKVPPKEAAARAAGEPNPNPEPKSKKK